ncbi:MAG: LacI family DNA-binding transcriptional regulator [Lachnospiraceae bacterium]|nr:LacI family DNA-binding transcriptional regulator [Lachnospiraceae bacterium]
MENITITDIARMCGVSATTVSRAINNNPGISRSTKEKIQEIIKEYNYVPNNSARNLKRIESDSIAVLAKGISNPYISEMIRIGGKEAEKRKYSFFFQRVDDDENELDVAIELMKEKRLKGIIFFGGLFEYDAHKLEQLGVPVVCCTIGAKSSDGKERCSSVYVDDIVESYNLIDYLCGLGHKKIAMITSPDDDESIGKLRYMGYLKALEKHQIPVDFDLIAKLKPNLDGYSIKNGYMVTKELLSSGKEFSALFVPSDYMAIGACKAIFDEGKRVPEDYSVVGYDGLEVAEYYNPSITTIRQPIKKMAEMSLEILFQEIEKGTAPKRIVFDGQLLIGQSTAKYQKN